MRFLKEAEIRILIQMVISFSTSIFQDFKIRILYQVL
jgi:hypothetical protein